jgi:Icc-related predicted phosphoesterase
MIIDCLSDIHGFYPKLEGGDLLIIAGDLTARHTDKEWHEFATWMDRQDYKKIIFIAGNHDTMIERWDKEQDAEGYKGPVSDANDRIEYLCDSGTEFEALKIWGSPWSLTFPGMNPECKAFTVDTEEELGEKWALIPDDIDILITHSPPFAVLDLAKKSMHPERKSIIDDYPNGEYIHVGSTSLDKKIGKMNKYPKLHVFGHIHESYGQIEVNYKGASYKMINASHVNERYQPVNKPIRIIL